MKNSIYELAAIFLVYQVKESYFSKNLKWYIEDK